MANEVQGFVTFVGDVLLNDEAVAALVGDRIFEDEAPQGTAFPYVIVSQNRARVLNAQGADARIHVRPAFLIRATVQDESYADADALASAVDAALTGAKGTATVGDTTYHIRGVFQTSPVRYPTSKDGVHYRHSGGIYEAFVHT